ncbi:class I SAM-dependent methyltransferase [Lysobacter sp. A3-1-A15]
MKRLFQIEFLRGRNLAPADHLLDLGCGTLRGGIPLIDYLDAGGYVGIDVREEVIVEARAELELHGLGDKRATLLATDGLAALALGRSFDVVWAFSVLIHMDDAHLEEALEFTARHLAPAGVLYANVNVGERAPGGWQGFPVMWRPLAAYADAARRAGLEVEDLGALGGLGHDSGVAAQDAQRMLVFRHAG